MKGPVVHIFLEIGDVGIIICPGPEIQPRDKPETVQHYINAKQQGNAPYCYGYNVKCFLHPESS